MKREYLGPPQEIDMRYHQNEMGKKCVSDQTYLVSSAISRFSHFLPSSGKLPFPCVSQPGLRNARPKGPSAQTSWLVPHPDIHTNNSTNWHFLNHFCVVNLFW